MNRKELSTAVFIARKNIFKNWVFFALTVLIISLGFITSTVLYGTLQDSAYDAQESYIETNVGHVVLEPYRDNEKIENVENVIKNIEMLPHVFGVAKINRKTVKIVDSEENVVHTELYIVDPVAFSETSLVDDFIADGAWLQEGAKDQIVMGCVFVKGCNEIEAFDRVDVKSGGKLSLVSDEGVTELSLHGVYDTIYIQAELSSYISGSTASEIFSDYDPSKADLIIVKLPGRNYAKQTVEELSRMNLNAKISSWEEKATKYDSLVDSFTIIGDISFFIGVFVSAISIYIILYINILNKRVQIGILKAIGIRSSVIFFSYILISLFLGILGSALGIGLTFLVIEIFRFSGLQTGLGFVVPLISLEMFMKVTVGTLVVSVLSGYIVSKRITKQNIIDSIRYG